MCGVQFRPTFNETFEENMQGLTLTCLSTCPSDKEATENVVLFFLEETTLPNKMHYYSDTITTENQTNDCYPLPIGYLAYSRPPQNTTVPH
jgi:hypothetical protein